MLLPVSQSKSIIYTLNMNQTLQQWKQSIIDNSHSMIKQFNVENQNEDISLNDLMSQGQFNINVNN